MLSELQEHLAGIYRADPGYDVRDFLITDPTLASILGKGSMLPDTEETVLLREEAGELEMSLFLDAGMLARLDDAKPMSALKPSQLADLWTVLEGISHFNYIAWRARKNRNVSLLELELQAEIDKYVSTYFLAHGQEHGELATHLHDWLFGEVSFNPRLTAEQRERYQTANSYAARFCHGLRQRLASNHRAGLRELRHFYRLSQRDKISHINALTYSH